jgi:pyruvate/2-oxoglutarate dehydrogenase complex dihydrolipoamide dehydrogenase (E3) component
MIHTCIAYMKMGATVDDMWDTIYVHPALPEVVRAAVRNAVGIFESKL